MPRESRRSMISSEDGATYYIRSRTHSHTPFFEDPDIKTWIYNHFQWMATIYCVSYQAISITDDSYRLVLKMSRPELSDEDLRLRFTTLQTSRRRPLKWYGWRTREWAHKFTDLSEFMKHLNQSTAKYVKERLKHKGHIWRDRFKAEHLPSERDQLAARAYVDLTALRVGKVEQPLTYPWCSAHRLQADPANSAVVIEAASEYLALLERLVEAGLGDASVQKIKLWLEMKG